MIYSRKEMIFHSRAVNAQPLLTVLVVVVVAV
jgi:hypothetical protein